METLLGQIRDLAAKVDQTDRRVILDKLRGLQHALEAPEDTMQRILFLVRDALSRLITDAWGKGHTEYLEVRNQIFSTKNLQLASIKVGIDLKIFNELTSSSIAVDVDRLASSTGADHLLLGRLLRYLASIGVITEVAKDCFSANNITKTLADEGNQAGVYHYFDTVGPQYQDFPAVLAEKGYKNLSDNTQTVFNKTFQTGLPAFIWFQQQPERFNHFNKYMGAQRQGMPTWLNVYPIANETRNWDTEKAVFLDVGGGFGHQCAALQATYPDLPGQVILQDLPQAIEHALPSPKVTSMVHDFFQPQPIKGAKYYYLRNILHDYPDEKCLAILSNLKTAMSKDSRILIDEMVLPDTGSSWQATQLDLTMMIGLGSMERTKEQWSALYDAAGLRILEIYPYNVSVHDSVTAVGLMDA